MSGRFRGEAGRSVPAIVVMCVVMCVLGSLAGCGNASDGAGATGSPNSPALPPDFPSDLPFPSGKHERTEVSETGGTTTVVLEGNFDLDAELTHLRAAFDQAGYDVTQHTRAESGSLDQLYLEVTGPSHDVSVAIINRSSLGVATYEVTHQP